MNKNKNNQPKTNLEAEDFMNYIHSPKRIILSNFLAGLFRGVGAVVGATILLALVVYVLNIFVDFPVIGQYLEDIKNILEQASRT